MPLSSSLHQQQHHQHGSHRKIAIEVDLSDESAFAVKWVVVNYLRPGDNMILLHIRLTNDMYGADWDSIDLFIEDNTYEESQQKLEDDFDAFTSTKSFELAQPLVDAHIPFKIHFVKDHDMKEILFLEVKRLVLNIVIMRIQGFGASRKTYKGRLGSVSDYFIHHYVCSLSLSYIRMIKMKEELMILTKFPTKIS